jgi:poly-gamma-glutamate synthesis protein (capsule biosynthesis protein)
MCHYIIFADMAQTCYNINMATRKKSHHKKYARFILVFAATLSIILLSGLAAIFVYQHILRTNELRERSENLAVFLAEINNTAADQMKIGEIDNDKPAEPDEEPIPEEESAPARYAGILNDPDYMQENRIYYREPDIPGEARLLFAGDTLFDDRYAVMATAKKRDGTVENAFSSDLLELMRSADVMMLNNEFTYTKRGEPYPQKLFTFRANPDTAAWLNDMGVNIVSLANNHTYDYGEISLLDTLDTLEEHGVPYAGAGRNIDEAAAPVYFIVGDLKIAIIAATQIERLDPPDTRGATATLPGVFRCWWSLDRLLEAVAEAKENSDFVVVFIHWGTENVTEPDWAQLEQGLKIAAAGADLIVGAHPHVLQGITYHGDTPIAYSLGNFWFSSRSVDTGLLEATIDENGLKTLRLIPALQENCFTSLLHNSAYARVLDSVRALSPNISIDEDGIITKR